VGRATKSSKLNLKFDSRVSINLEHLNMRLGDILGHNSSARRFGHRSVDLLTRQFQFVTRLNKCHRRSRGKLGDQTIRVARYCHQISGLFKMTYITSIAAFALLIPLVASNQILRSIESSQPNITRTITLSPPASPALGRQIHDAAYQSFSIEFSYMADYGGNNSCAIIKLL
jgi:hypothetical protein